MKFINKSLDILKESGNKPTLYRLQGYCLAKGYHLYMSNHCCNDDYRIDYIKICDNKSNTIASASVSIRSFSPIRATFQYC